MNTRLSYALVTPARNEAENVGRLATAVSSQTQLPSLWVIVDHGSNDTTLDVANRLADREAWIRVLSIPRAPGPARRRASVEAFNAGLDLLEIEPDIVVKLDADVSFRPDYFERLTEAFTADPELGIASGTVYEEQRGQWIRRHTTRSSVWGACRAYRWSCLPDVFPLEERLGWDGIDELKANVHGWSTRTIPDLPFRHHRPEGTRDGDRLSAWRTEGATAHYMGYRPSYLIARALFRARRERSALTMIGAYSKAALRHEPRCTDQRAVDYLRARQRLRELPGRFREAVGKA